MSLTDKDQVLEEARGRLTRISRAGLDYGERWLPEDQDALYTVLTELERSENEANRLRGALNEIQGVAHTALRPNQEASDD